MRRPTTRDPVKAIKRMWGLSTSASPTTDPDPVRKLTTPAGNPTSSRIRTNCAAIAGDVLAGLRITVLPATKAALVIPAMIAHGKFQGGITAPTPSGI